MRWPGCCPMIPPPRARPGTWPLRCRQRGMRCMTCRTRPWRWPVTSRTSTAASRKPRTRPAWCCRPRSSWRVELPIRNPHDPNAHRPRRSRAAGPVIVASGRKASRHLDRIAAAQERKAGPVAASRVFRFRYQLAPLAYLAVVLAGLAARQAGRWVPYVWAVVAAAAVVGWVAVVVATRHRSRFVRWHVQGQAGLAGVWAVVTCLIGLGPWTAAWLLAWAAGYALWGRKYRWRPGGSASVTAGAEETWARLAERMKWTAWLGPGQPVGAGVRYEVVCDGIDTIISDITGHGKRIAGAFHAPLTQVYPERHPDSAEHHGFLTVLRSGATLETPRPWPGTSIDPATGLAVIGRFPDGTDAHEVYFNLPQDGTKHTLVTGADGSGKTATINLGLAISAVSGLIAPVILDPQEGQALPAWREHVPYAAGVDACLVWLHGLHDGMMARSAELAGMMWCADHGAFLNQCGRDCTAPYKGMGFFNPFMVDLPIVEITIDEAPVLLAIEEAARLILSMAKLSRKTGFRLRLAAQVPSLRELKAQELRSILNGGTVIAHRAGDKVTAGYVNIAANLNEIPKRFPNGQPTWGLGYTEGPDMRPDVPMRTDLLADIRAREVARTTRIRGLDQTVADRLAAAIASGDELAEALRQGSADAALRQLQIIAALAQPMTLGDLIKAVGLKPSEVSAEVTALMVQGRIRKTGELLVLVRP